MPFLLGTSEASRNFNPANDIIVKFVTNRERSEVGDYIVAVNNGVIDSRWFVFFKFKIKTIKTKILSTV